MKKLFLTSGIILCMACPALATTDIDYDSQTGTYSATGYANPTCVEDITGQEADNSDAAFEARWTPVTYQISFAGGTASNNGHSHNVTATTMGNQDAVFDTDVTLNANTYAVTGYRFNQWSCTGNNTSGTSVTNTYANQAHINPFQYISNLACTATWTPETYDVIYNKGAGAAASNYTDTDGATYDGAYTIPAGASAAATPQTGYTFMGWSTDSNPTVTRTPRTNETGAINTGTVTNAWTGTSQWTETSDKTVYAAYMPMQYNITYAAGDSANNGTGTAGTGTTAATYAQYGSPATLATNAFTLTGYGFNGWSCEDDDASITVSYSNGQTVNPWNVASGLRCTAQWTAGTTAVTYSCGSGTGVSGTAPSGNNLDTATYDSPYSFATNSGNCAKTGYTFQGWSCTGLNGTQTAGGSITWAYTGESTTCTAVYGANTISLAWYADTVENGATTPIEVQSSAESCIYDDTITIPDQQYQPRKTGYTFEGWRVR